MASSRTLFNHAINRIRTSHHSAPVTIQTPWDDRNQQTAQISSAIPHQLQQQANPVNPSVPHRRFYSQVASPSTNVASVQSAMIFGARNPAINQPTSSGTLYSNGNSDVTHTDQSNVKHRSSNTHQRNPNLFRTNHKSLTSDASDPASPLYVQQHFPKKVSNFLSALHTRNTTEAWSKFLALEHSNELIQVSMHDMNFFLQLVRKSSHRFGQDEDDRLLAMERIFNSMSRAGFEPDIGTFVILANAHATAGNLEKVIELFAEIERLNLGTPKMKLAIICVAQAKCGKLMEAEKSFLDIITNNPDVPRFEVMGAFNAVLDGFIHHSEFHDRVVAWYERASEFKITPDGLTYDSMIEFYCNVSDFDAAKDLLDAKKKQGFVPTTRSYNSLIRGHLKVGNFSSALKVFKSMSANKVPANATTYNFILSAYQGTEDTVAVWRLYLAMLRAKIVPSRNTWACLAKGIGKHTDRIREDIEAAGGVPSKLLYRHLLDGFRHLNDCDAVLSVAEQYKQEEARSPSQWHLTLDVLNTVLSCLCEGGREEEAAQYFQEIKIRKLNANQFTYNAMISLYSRSAVNPAKAQAILNEMINAAVLPDSFTFNQIINSVWQVGSPLNENALDYARKFAATEMSYQPKRDFVLHKLLEKVGDGDAKVGLKILRREPSELATQELLITPTSQRFVPLQVPNSGNADNQPATLPPSPLNLSDSSDFDDIERELYRLQADQGLFKDIGDELGKSVIPPHKDLVRSDFVTGLIGQDAFVPRKKGLYVTNVSQLF